jgi:hypothetical protein
LEAGKNADKARQQAEALAQQRHALLQQQGVVFVNFLQRFQQWPHSILRLLNQAPSMKSWLRSWSVASAKS